MALDLIGEPVLFDKISSKRGEIFARALQASHSLDRFSNNNTLCPTGAELLNTGDMPAACVNATRSGCRRAIIQYRRIGALRFLPRRAAPRRCVSSSRAHPSRLARCANTRVQPTCTAHERNPLLRSLSYRSQRSYAIDPNRTVTATAAAVEAAGGVS